MTFFTIPKPFQGHIEVIQRNAIRSWMQLRPSSEIILFGDDEGTAETAAELGVHHIPTVTRNEYGTPLLNDLIEKAQQLAAYDLLCYVNADIIILSDFQAAVRRIPFRDFLMVGQRWDVDLDHPLDFEQRDWESRLREYTSHHGNLLSHWGIDYFVFSRGIWDAIPPFAIGRTAWDNWLIYRAHSRGVPVIDTTQAVMAVHQNHDYVHLSGGRGEAFKGSEATHNFAMAGGYRKMLTVYDADWVLTQHRLLPATEAGFQRRRQVRLSLGMRFALIAYEFLKQGEPKEAACCFLRACCSVPWLLTSPQAVRKLVRYALPAYERSTVVAPKRPINSIVQQFKSK